MPHVPHPKISRRLSPLPEGNADPHIFLFHFRYRHPGLPLQSPLMQARDQLLSKQGTVLRHPILYAFRPHTFYGKIIRTSCLPEATGSLFSDFPAAAGPPADCFKAYIHPPPLPPPDPAASHKQEASSSAGTPCSTEVPYCTNREEDLS